MTPGHNDPASGSRPSATVPSIERYLSAIAAGLPADRITTDVLAELRTGMFDAADAYQSAGLHPSEAVAAAIREFGEPHQVAAAFRPELAASIARRTGLILVRTAPLVALLWLAAGRANHLGIRHAAPWTWPNAPSGAELLFPLLAAALAIAVPAAAITIITTGRDALSLADRPRLAPTSAAIASAGIMLADLAVLVLLATDLATTHHANASPVLIAAAFASITRLTLAGRNARRVLAARAALTHASMAQ